MLDTVGSLCFQNVSRVSILNLISIMAGTSFCLMLYLEQYKLDNYKLMTASKGEVQTDMRTCKGT